jgi:hypothetical protein
MAVIRPEWAITNALTPGPEVYAPPDRRPPEGPTHARIAAVRPQTAEADQSEDRSSHLESLIRRVAGAAVNEIDSVVNELESVREMLRNESERVSREVAAYVVLNHASITAMKTIAANIKKWKGHETDR